MGQGLKKRPGLILSLGLAGLAVLVLLAGCASTPRANPSGFLSDYNRLKQDPQDESIWYWEKPGVDWGKYRKFMLDHVRVRIDKKKAQRELTQAELNKLAGDFRKVVAKELSSGYEVVSRPGPGVLQVSAAIVDVIPVNPAINMMSGAALLMPLDLGGASIEVKFLDSVSGELLAEMSDTKRQSHLTLNMGWKRWSHVQEAFEDWAKEFKKAIDQGPKK